MSGRVPLAVTDNLNFGNPHQPEIFWQLREAVNGLAEACRFFHTPVTGGNVSLYNQSPAGAIAPTPTVGMVGLISDEKHITRSHFQHAGDSILLLGDWGWEVAGTMYAREIHGLRTGHMPQIHLHRERDLQETVRAMIATGHVHSAHDISDGGLALAWWKAAWAAKSRSERGSTCPATNDSTSRFSMNAGSGDCFGAARSGPVARGSGAPAIRPPG